MKTGYSEMHRWVRRSFNIFLESDDLFEGGKNIGICRRMTASVHLFHSKRAACIFDGFVIELVKKLDQ